MLSPWPAPQARIRTWYILWLASRACSMLPWQEPVQPPRPLAPGNEFIYLPHRQAHLVHFVVGLQCLQRAALPEDGAQRLVLAPKAQPHQAVPLAEVDRRRRVARLNAHDARVDLGGRPEVVLAHLHVSTTVLGGNNRWQQVARHAWPTHPDFRLDRRWRCLLSHSLASRCKHSSRPAGVAPAQAAACLPLTASTVARLTWPSATPGWKPQGGCRETASQ